MSWGESQAGVDALNVLLPHLHAYSCHPVRCPGPNSVKTAQRLPVGTAVAARGQNGTGRDEVPAGQATPALSISGGSLPRRRILARCSRSSLRTRTEYASIIALEK